MIWEIRYGAWSKMNSLGAKFLGARPKGTKTWIKNLRELPLALPSTIKLRRMGEFLTVPVYELEKTVVKIDLS